MGALLSGLTAGAITYFDYRTNRDEERSARAADKRAAIRLVIAEIRADEAELETLQQFGIVRSAAFRMTAWRNEQGTLARYLPEKEWGVVASFYEDLEGTIARFRQRQCISMNDRDFALFAYQSGLEALQTFGEDVSNYRSLGSRGEVPCPPASP